VQEMWTFFNMSSQVCSTIRFSAQLTNRPSTTPTKRALLSVPNGRDGQIYGWSPWEVSYLNALEIFT